MPRKRSFWWPLPRLRGLVNSMPFHIVSLTPGTGVFRCYMDRTAARCLQYERLFVTAGRDTEIAKNTVSFWLQKTISRAYQLSGRFVPDPPLRAWETRGIAPSFLSKKNFAVAQVLKAGTWLRHTTFTHHYLRDLTHWFLKTFHLGPVVATRALV